jgi:hypothetical protein
VAVDEGIFYFVCGVQDLTSRAQLIAWNVNATEPEAAAFWVLRKSDVRQPTADCGKLLRWESSALMAEQLTTNQRDLPNEAPESA